MAPPERKADATTVASPCIGLCQLNASTGLCDGCLRTIDEIAAWRDATEADKRRIWEAIFQRRREVFGE